MNRKFFTYYSSIPLLSLTLLFSACQKEKKLDAEFIRTELSKTSDLSEYMPDHAQREKDNQLRPMDSEVMVRLPIAFEGYEMSEPQSSVLPLVLDPGYQMIPLINTIRYDYTIKVADYESYSSFFELEDFNGRKKEYSKLIRETMNKPEFKNKKVYNIDSLNNAVGFTYTETDNVVGGNEQYIRAFFYDRFVLTVRLQDPKQLEKIKQIVAANVKAMAPYRSKAYPEISNPELVGRWVVSGAEITDTYVNAQPPEMLAIGKALGMDFKTYALKNIESTLVGKYVFHLDSGSMTHVEMDNKPFNKGAYVMKNDTAYFTISDIPHAFYKTAKGDMAVQPATPSKSPLILVKKEAAK